MTILLRAVTTVLLLLAAVAAQAHELDLKRLPIGDNRHATAPRAGYIWPCRVDPDAGGAFRDGPWIDKANGVYDFTTKAKVSGAVMWNPRFTFRLQGDRRVFSTNDLPNHPTGTFPIPSSDTAYQYDRNPNRIREQEMSFELPAEPRLATASCAPGAVGILLSGSVLFNALDAPGRDAVAHETQDSCQGHPQVSGVYHYHSVTTCLDDKRLPDGHAALVGYMVDGFGIFGRFGEKGAALASDDLDECHGHTHEMPWDGRMVAMYHYHATWDFPYTAGCMRGTVDQRIVRLISGPPPSGGGPGGGPPGGGPGGPPPRGGPGGPGDRPPFGRPPF